MGMDWLPWGGGSSKGLTLQLVSSAEVDVWPVAGQAGSLALIQQDCVFLMPWACLPPVSFPKPDGCPFPVERDKEGTREVGR